MAPRLTPRCAKRDNCGVDAIPAPLTETVQDSVAQAMAAADELLQEVADVLQRSPGLDADTVRHTLALLRLDPLTRLNRSLIRGRAAAAYQT